MFTHTLNLDTLVGQTKKQRARFWKKFSVRFNFPLSLLPWGREESLLRRGFSSSLHSPFSFNFLLFLSTPLEGNGLSADWTDWTRVVCVRACIVCVSSERESERERGGFHFRSLIDTQKKGGGREGAAAIARILCLKVLFFGLLVVQYEEESERAIQDRAKKWGFFSQISSKSWRGQMTSTLRLARGWWDPLISGRILISLRN